MKIKAYLIKTDKIAPLLPEKATRNIGWSTVHRRTRGKWKIINTLRIRYSMEYINHYFFKFS